MSDNLPAPPPAVRGARWPAVALITAIVMVFAGLGLVGVQKIREAAARTQSANNMGQIGKAAHGFHDTALRLPSNGVVGQSPGLYAPTSSPTRMNGPGDTVAILRGPYSASFFVQIVPNLECSSLYARPEQATDEHPVRVKSYSEPGRDRIGHITGRPTTDYAVNAGAIPGVNEEHPIATYNLQAMSALDGTANTVLAGQKSMFPSDYHDPAADVSFLDLSAAGGTLMSGTVNEGATTTYATSRGNASVVSDGKEPPRFADTATTVRDSAAAPGPGDNFGGPYSNGVLFVFCDAHVQLLSYSWLNGDGRRFGGEGWQSGPGQTCLGAILTPAGSEAYVLE